MLFFFQLWLLNALSANSVCEQNKGPQSWERFNNL